MNKYEIPTIKAKKVYDLFKCNDDDCNVMLYYHVLRIVKQRHPKIKSNIHETNVNKMVDDYHNKLLNKQFLDSDWSKLIDDCKQRVYQGFSNYHVYKGEKYWLTQAEKFSEILESIYQWIDKNKIWKG